MISKVSLAGKSISYFCIKKLFFVFNGRVPYPNFCLVTSNLLKKDHLYFKIFQFPLFIMCQFWQQQKSIVKFR
jgi:hypothetical protein